MIEDAPGFEVGRRMVEVHAALAGARDLDEIVRAIVAALAPTGPHAIDFSQVHAGPDGAAHEIEVVRVWQDGRVAAEHPMYGRRFAFRGSPFGEAVLRDPRRAFYVEDTAGLGPSELADVPRDLAAIAVLPLYSERHAAWQGMVVVQWTRPHAPDAAERLLHALLIHATAEALASERSRLRNADLLGEVQAALRDSRRKQRLLAVLFEHLPVGVTVLRGDTGTTEFVNPAGRAAMGYDAGSEAVAATGSHVHRPGDDTPMALEELPPYRVFRGSGTIHEELEFRRPDGERRIFDVTATPLEDPQDPTPRAVLMFHDITAVRAAERERLATQEALLAAQAAALAERSTPLIPVRDDVLVMPLIGTIDPERGRQVLETLVHLGGRARVRAAILDLTGVRGLDAAAAGMLLAAARAARLRGVQAILTGLSPEAAATLVALGVDFSGITVLSSLQEAVARTVVGPR